MTDARAEAIEAARLALQDRTGRTRQSTQRDAETAVAAAVGPLLAPIRALASGPAEPGYQPYAADICGEVRFVVLLDDLRAALDAIEAGATSGGGRDE